MWSEVSVKKTHWWTLSCCQTFCKTSQKDHKKCQQWHLYNVSAVQTQWHSHRVTSPALLFISFSLPAGQCQLKTANEVILIVGQWHQTKQKQTKHWMQQSASHDSAIVHLVSWGTARKSLKISCHYDCHTCDSFNSIHSELPIFFSDSCTGWQRSKVIGT